MDINFHCDSKQNFKNENQQVRAFLYTDYSIKPHNHDFYELNIIMQGNGTHQIENACFRVETGDVFMISPMMVHAYYGTEDLDVYHILLHKDFIRNNQKENASIPGFFQLVEIEPFLRQNFSKKMFLHLSHGQILQLKTDLSFIADNSVYDTEEMIPFKKHTTWKILYWLSALLFNQIYAGSKKVLNKYDIEIVRTLEYIHQNYDSKITIDLLCQKSLLSRSTFLRSFRSVCGCTPMEYINRYRCKKALEMIDNVCLSKTEIAHCCGFYDLSHMERTMKQLL
ncbi:MAG: helix-turn-helix domain-containing protein [Ruminococcaceae bacterium]|nr:helix-turn-helix domain-containing protein [Oscillospiraceae bacterium]